MTKVGLLGGYRIDLSDIRADDGVGLQLRNLKKVMNAVVNTKRAPSRVKPTTQTRVPRGGTRAKTRNAG